LCTAQQFRALQTSLGLLCNAAAAAAAAAAACTSQVVLTNVPEQHSSTVQGAANTFNLICNALQLMYCCCCRRLYIAGGADKRA
jgi:hypothetical protein